jgi:hypothetical protein
LTVFGTAQEFSNDQQSAVSAMHLLDLELEDFETLMKTSMVDVILNLLNFTLLPYPSHPQRPISFLRPHMVFCP